MGIVDWNLGLILAIILIGMVSIRYLIVGSRWDIHTVKDVLDIVIVPFLIVFTVNILTIAINLV